jgi:hypothetical protein
MALDPAGVEVQGCNEEGTPYQAERPVEIAGRDLAGNIKVPLFNADGSTPVTVLPGGGPTAVTIADGADTAEGSTTDAAVTGDNPGTISAKLRGLLKIITNVWDSLNSRLNVAVQNIVSVAQTGTWNVGLLAGANHVGSVNVDNFPAVQPVSGTVTTTTTPDQTIRLQLQDQTLLLIQILEQLGGTPQ